MLQAYHTSLSYSIRKGTVFTKNLRKFLCYPTRKSGQTTAVQIALAAAVSADQDRTGKAPLVEWLIHSSSGIRDRAHLNYRPVLESSLG